MIMTMLVPKSGLRAQDAPAVRILVAYYSYSGNTRTVAEIIREATGGDLFEIVPEKAYPSGYQAVVDQAKKEIAAGHRPVLKSRVADIGSYDVIIVGSPCWWGTVAPPVATFLSGYDLAGKTVVPFMTHEGSRMGHSQSDIEKLCPASTVLKGLPVRGGSAKQAGEEVGHWLRDLKLVK